MISLRKSQITIKLVVFYLELLTGDIQRVFIYFAYGLVLFTMGISVTMQCKQFSAFELGKHLKWLGFFGITHALAEWTYMFKVILSSSELLTLQDELRALEAILATISFVFLMIFSTRVFTSFPKKRRVIRILHPFLGISWCLMLFIVTKKTGVQNVFPVIIVLTRYFVCFPSSILAAYCFLLQARAFQEPEYKKLRKYLYGVAITFTLYAVFSGLIIRDQEFFISKYLTYTFIENATGIPVPIHRAFIATLIAYFTIQSMRLFNLEYSIRLAQAEKENTLMQERERISGDLHDGTIQTLYGITLLLENSQSNIHEEAPKQQINYALTYLNDSIQELRLFINSLRTPSLASKPFSNLIVSRVELFSKARTGLTFLTDSASFTKLDWLSPDERYNVLCIAQEVLANIIKHSYATEVKVYCEEETSCLVLCIEDNGQSIDSESILSYQGPGLGLRSITARARNLRAIWSWMKKKDNGNTFRLNLYRPTGGGGIYAD